MQLFQQHQISYEQLERQLIESGQPQVSTTDPDSRSLLVHNQVDEVFYNTQAADEAKHNLNATDFTILADKGYHNACEIENCQL